MTRLSSQKLGTARDEVQLAFRPALAPQPCGLRCPLPQEDQSVVSRAGAETSRPVRRGWGAVGYAGSQLGRGVSVPGDSLAASLRSCRGRGCGAGEGRTLKNTSGPAPAPIINNTEPGGKSPGRASCAARHPRA